VSSWNVSKSDHPSRDGLGWILADLSPLTAMSRAMTKIRVGHWRDDSNGPMQVVSGPVGREKVHYEAPPAKGQQESASPP